MVNLSDCKYNKRGYEMWYYIYKRHGIHRTKGQKKKCIYLCAVFLIVCFSVLGLGSTVRAAEDSLEYMYIRATDFPEGEDRKSVV